MEFSKYIQDAIAAKNGHAQVARAFEATAAVEPMPELAPSPIPARREITAHAEIFADVAQRRANAQMELETGLTAESIWWAMRAEPRPPDAIDTAFERLEADDERIARYRRITGESPYVPKCRQNRRDYGIFPRPMFIAPQIMERIRALQHIRHDTLTHTTNLVLHAGLMLISEKIRRYEAEALMVFERKGRPVEVERIIDFTSHRVTEDTPRDPAAYYPTMGAA